MKKILVTGGAGYIGSHTVAELDAAGYQPVIVDDFSNSGHAVISGLAKITGKNISLHTVNCTDIKALRKVFADEGQIAGIIHFAAFKAVGESVEQPFKYYHNNLNTTNNVLELMREFNVRNLIFSSSCTVYGQPVRMPVDESAPIVEASSPYGHTKQICESMIRHFQRKHPEMRSVILRYFNPIGAHPSALIGELPLGTPDNLVPFITQTAAGIRSRLTIFGSDYNTEDGTCVRDYIHVADLARAHVRALYLADKMNPSSEIINLGLGRGYSVKEVVETFEKVTGIKVAHQMGNRRPGDIAKIYSSSEKATRLLDWSCEYDLGDMLKHAWAWQQQLGKKKSD